LVLASQLLMLIVCFISAAIVTFLACFPVIRFLNRRAILDHPGERSSHEIPTPRGGGIALVAVLVVGLTAFAGIMADRNLAVLAGGVLLLAVVSFTDDLHPLPQGIRFCVHLISAAILLLNLETPGEVPLGINQDRRLLLLLWYGGLWLYLVGYSNAFNFMDGINGLAAVQTIVSGLGVVIVASIVAPKALFAPALAGALLAGVACGFLPHNFPRARVFLGDVGSVPLGFVSAALAVTLAQEAGWWLIVPLALLHANYILDTSITFCRRVLRGDKWYLPHREHFYQRLVRSGKTHTAVTTWELLLQAAVLAAVIFYLHLPAARIAIVLTVVLMWLLFFAWAEFRFRAGHSQAASSVRPLRNAETKL
jgi:UDP-N-acetylmuramyl pentapeptide phosphotransferase/UDP-N-acetylglucosamine-1-phosphate transferase